MDAYAIAHVALYVTEFGTRGPHALGWHGTERLRRSLRLNGWTACADGAIDVLTELAIGDVLLGGPSADLGSAAHALVSMAQHADGSVPMTRGRRDGITVAEVYHSTLVWAYYSSLVARRERIVRST